MAVPLTMPTGISDELEQALAAIYAQLGTIGQIVDIPYQARYFSVDTGTITPKEGGIYVLAYTLIGTCMTVFFSLRSMTVTGSPNYITITAPEGFRVRPGNRHLALVSRLYTQPCIIQTDTGDIEAGEVWVTNTASLSNTDNSGSQVSLHFHQLDDGTFSSLSGSIGLFGHCTFDCERVT